MEHFQYVVLAEVIVDLHVEIEPCEAGHQRVSLQYRGRILAVLRFATRHVEACYLIFLCVRVRMIHSIQADYPHVLAPFILAVYYLGPFWQVRGIYAVPFQYCNREHVALVSGAEFLCRFLLALGQLGLINIFRLPITSSLFGQAFNKGIELAHHAFKPEFFNPALIEVKLAVQEACPVIVFAEHSQLEQANDILKVDARLLAERKTLFYRFRFLDDVFLLTSHLLILPFCLSQLRLKLGYLFILFTDNLVLGRYFGFQIADMTQVSLSEFP